jgi:hypothetical protein
LQSSPPYSAAILAAGCAVLLVTATYATVRELGPFATENLSERSTVTATAMGMLEPALSLQSQTNFLYHCRVAMTSITGRVQPTTIRRAILDVCRDGSQQIVANSPGFSVAWYTGALVASFTGEQAAMREWLSQSYATGPFEQWIAELRVDLAEDHFAQLTPQLVELHLADLRMLLSGDPGRRFLAPRYINFPGLRGRVDTILAGMDASGASRFRNIVERLSVEKGRTNGR